MSGINADRMAERLVEFAAQGALAAASGPRSVINCVAYSADGQRRGDITIEAISDVLEEPSGFVWLGLHEPDEALLLKIQEEFGLHDLAIEDAHHAHQRPKIEIYGDVLFIVVHTAQFVDGGVRFGESHIFLGKRFLITVRHGASLSYSKARGHCEQTPDLLALGPSFGLYAVLDFIVDNYFPIVRSFEAGLHAIESRIFDERYDPDTIEGLYRLKRELLTLRLAVVPMHDILNQLQRFFPQLICDEVRVYFRDVYDHAVRMSDTISTMSEMVSAALTVNLSMVTVGQNEVTKKLAGWAAILAIPTVVGAIYGMNFEHMPELGWSFGYPAALGLIATVCTALYLRLKRARWL